MVGIRGEQEKFICKTRYRIHNDVHGDIITQFHWHRGVGSSEAN